MTLVAPRGAVRLALLQLSASGNDQAANRAKGDAYCRLARAMGADLALFPEMWNIGYTPYKGSPGHVQQTGLESPAQIAARADWQARAIPTDGPWVAHFRALARELEMAIALTYLEQWPGAPRNTVSLIDRHGEIVLTYAKVHTCDFGMEAACTPGTEFPVVDLDTAVGPARIGAMICFDREFPESGRMLMLAGAEIILAPNACTLESHRLGQIRTRAFENMTAIAVANHAAPRYNGHSIALDGIAFHPDGSTRDMLLMEAGETEGVFTADIDLAALRAYREREIWGDAFRRPHRYSLLVEAERRPPFMRHDAVGASYHRERR